MRKMYVGIDVSKDCFKVAVKDEGNNQVMPVKVYGHDRAGLEAFGRAMCALKEQTGCGALYGMEATGIYHLSVYQYLVDAEEDVKVFNGLELKRFKGRIRKTKTDDIDALAIAEALILVTEPTYHPSSEPLLIRL
ncbi:MAG: transposase, partial [Candidatus Thermoplasmatota archaeon]